jgi:hypothetical protein
VQWVDPPAIEPYQKYINYLEDVVIYNLKQKLAQALVRLDPPSIADDIPVAGPMVFKMNTDCEDEYCTCPCHEKKKNAPPATPSTLPLQEKQRLVTKEKSFLVINHDLRRSLLQNPRSLIERYVTHRKMLEDTPLGNHVGPSRVELMKRSLHACSPACSTAFGVRTHAETHQVRRKLAVWRGEVHPSERWKVETTREHGAFAA